MQVKKTPYGLPSRYPTPKIRAIPLEFLSRVSMQYMHSAILFYQFCLSVCLSLTLSVCPMLVLCQNKWT